MNLWGKLSAKALIILVVGLVAFGLALPSEYHVTRSIEIQAKPA